MNTQAKHWVQITAARGPLECAHAVPRILKILVAELQSEGGKADVLEAHDGPISGTLVSALLSVEGRHVQAVLSRWAGPVLWIARSPYRPAYKRRNWFVGVTVHSEPAALCWRMEDLRISMLCSSGPGGQNVNKRATAVRVVHVPTGLSVVGREERSQLANKKLALARLAGLFADRESGLRQSAEQERWSQHNQLERGNPVRVFEGLDFKERKNRA
jgi:peptide chain release factor